MIAERSLISSKGETKIPKLEISDATTVGLSQPAERSCLMVSTNPSASSDKEVEDNAVFNIKSEVEISDATTVGLSQPAERSCLMVSSKPSPSSDKEVKDKAPFNIKSEVLPSKICVKKEMSSKKVIAVCQSGGEFVKEKDGKLSYCGGEAYAIDISQQTQLSYFKKEVAEMFDCDVDSMIIKYFLPGNMKTLITVAKDKDLTRMVSFVGDTNTVDVFIIIKEENHAQNASDLPVSRSSRTTVSEAVACDPLPIPDVVMENVRDNDLADTRAPSLNVAETSRASSSRNKHHKVTQKWENVITGVDQRFNSSDEFREAVRRYAVAHGFAFKYKKYGNNRVIVKCKAEDCKWRICASRLATTQLICIKKMVDEHTCGGTDQKNCRGSLRWIGSMIKDKLKSSPNYRPQDIVDDIRRDFGIELNYSQAWRAKDMAKEQLQGSWREAYGQLPHLCKRITERNPGSVAKFFTKEDSSFHRLFLCFHASIIGFQLGCRPLIFLDSSPLGSKYQGELFAATSVDGDDGAFPLAFAVVDSETADNWQWFLEELRCALSMSEPITFISHFQNGLKETLSEVFSNCHHSYCLRYMAETLNLDLKGHLSHDARRFMVNDFYAAAYATQSEEFERCINNIKAISPEAYDWVVKSQPKQWANAFFEGPRYNLLTSNLVQLFFGWASEAGDLPITQMIDVLLSKMMDLICSRRSESNQWETRLTPSKQEKLEQEFVVAQSLRIQQSHGCMFEVRGDSLHVVDIDKWVCTCKRWQLTGLPCSHAIAVFHYIDKDPFDYCSKYFTLDCYHLAYAQSIEPVPNIEEPAESEVSQADITVAPPPTRPRGRPKMKPTDPVDIVKRTLQCTKCKALGHNKRTCKSS